jgi:hypothetical protein
MFCPGIQYVHCRAQVTPGGIYIIQSIIYRLAMDRLCLASKEIDYLQTKALKQMIILKTTLLVGQAFNPVNSR